MLRPSRQPSECRRRFSGRGRARTQDKRRSKLALRGRKIPRKLAQRAKRILVLLMDVDGTLTDGSVTLASTPDNHALEIKTFDAHDTQGLTLAVTAGLRTALTSGPARP